MLEFLRHQTKPIMITVAVIIIVSFIFWGGQTNKSGFDRGGFSPDHPMLTVFGDDYTMADVGRIQRDYQIAEELRLPGAQNFFAYDLVGLKFTTADKNSGMPLMVAGAPLDFAPNLVVLREALEKHGIRASDEEVQQTFRSLGQFQVNGQFDRDRDLNCENSLSERGLKLADVYDVVRDSIGLQKLQKLVSGNLVANPKVAAEYYTFSYQTIKAASIPFALEDFKKAAKITDEEISKYFEENKAEYKSPEKRAISYVIAPKPNTDGKNAEDTTKLRNAYNKSLGDLAAALLDPKADFEAEVKKAVFEPKLEIKTAPAFAMDAPPEEFKNDFEFLRAVFNNNVETHPISDPVQIDKGYAIFKVTKIDQPGQQELKDVKDKIRDTLAEQKGTEAMQKAANEAKKKLEEAVKSGKKFEDAAKEAGLNPQMLAEFSPARPLTDLSNGREISREAMTAPAGSFTKPLSTENGVILVYVISKDIRKSEDSATSKKSIASSLDDRTQNDLFRAWFERRYEEAGVKFDTILLTSSIR